MRRASTRLVAILAVIVGLLALKNAWEGLTAARAGAWPMAAIDGGLTVVGAALAVALWRAAQAKRV